MSLCNHSGAIFNLNGPATGGVAYDTSHSSLSTWSGTSTANDLIITIADHDNVSFDGRYEVEHVDGKSSETSELLICHIKQPTNKLMPS